MLNRNTSEIIFFLSQLPKQASSTWALSSAGRARLFIPFRYSTISCILKFGIWGMDLLYVSADSQPKTHAPVIRRNMTWKLSHCCLYPFFRIHEKKASAALNSGVSYKRNGDWERLLRVMEGEKKGRWRNQNVQH